MRLSTVFELLVIALLIAFAASRVIDGPDRSKALSRDLHRFTIGRQSQDPPARHCTCSSLTCNCCRDFSLPIVPVKGPGCATVSYLRDDAMMITMSFGDRVLRNITVNSKKPKPICMGMPGGISKFCGRLYNIKKDGENFKACLGLELRALDDVEAALRVSCFKFGPSGVNVEPGEALPAEKSKEDEEDDDDDYGLGGLDDDDEDDDDDFGLSEGEDDDDEDEDEENPPAKDTYNYVDSDSDADYTGLGSLSEELFGGFFGSSSKKRKPAKSQEEVYVPNPPKLQEEGHSQSAPPQVNLVVMQPVILTTPKPPRRSAQKKPAKKPATISPTTTTPTITTTTSTTPVKKIKTTPSPVRTLAPSTTPSVTPSTTAPPKKKKKKKPSRRRNPTTVKPTSNNSIDYNPTIVTSTTMTVNVVQGEVNLNNTKPQAVEKPSFDSHSKIPMSQPVVETKPMDQPHDPLTNIEESMSQNVVANSNTEQVVIEVNEPTEVNESTTQTIMQNTIPTNENFNEVQLLNHDQVTIRTIQDQQNGEFGIENVINTTPGSWYSSEDTTNQETTVQEVLSSYTNNNFESIEKNSDKSTTMTFETTESGSDIVYDTTEFSTKNIDDDDEEKRLETVIENIETTKPLSSATVSYYAVEEGTDKTEVLTDADSRTQEISSEQNNESTVDDDDEDDDSDIDIGADLGLDDEDEEEEEINQKESLIQSKHEEKDDDDDDDILGGLLDDEDEEDSNKKEEEERALHYNPPYKINPLLFRLARVSTGSMATARHLPRFSDGRNRRNNKRMRFPSLEVIQ